MTNRHPITPSPELIREWIELSCASSVHHPNPYLLATYAARWGADEELNACCEWIDGEIGAIDTKDLRAAQRPKPPSLKEQLLKMLDPIYEGVSIQLTSDEQKLIVKALESLPDTSMF